MGPAIKWDEMPMPDSEFKDGANVLSDEFKWQEDGKDHTVWFYDGLFDRMPEGVKINSALDAISQCFGKNPQPAADNPFRSMGKGQLENARSLWGQRRNAGRNELRGAVKVIFQMAAINELGKDKGVACDFDLVTQKDGTKVLRDTTSVVLIQDTVNHKSKGLTVNQVNNLNIDEIAGKPGDFWENVVYGSAKRDKKKPEGQKTGTNIPEIKTRADFEQYAYSVANFMEQAAKGDVSASSGYTKLMGWLASAKAGTPERKLLVLSIGHIVVSLDPVWNVIGSEYQQYVSEQTAVEAAAGEAASTIAEAKVKAA
jgi:hypothetical protein